MGEAIDESDDAGHVRKNLSPVVKRPIDAKKSRFWDLISAVDCLKEGSA